MNISSCFQLGYITRKHGLKGEVGIFIDADDPLFYENMESVFLKIKDELVPFFIEKITLQNNKGIVKFEEIDTLEDAEKLMGCEMYLPQDILPDLGENKFYYHEIIGYSLNDKFHGAIGKITDIYTNGNQDLIAAEFQQKEILIPIIDELILSVDKKEKILHVQLPDGLIDIYLDEH